MGIGWANTGHKSKACFYEKEITYSMRFNQVIRRNFAALSTKIYDSIKFNPRSGLF